jgi:DNA replication protein DnaC
LCDEAGCDDLDSQKAHLFFQLVSQRYERGSMIVTTNRVFEKWGETLGGDEVVAAAVLDSLLHHNHVLVIEGPSCRLKDKLSK